MKYPALVLLCSLSATSWASPAPLLQSEARHAIQALAGKLQSSMKTAMQDGGPQAAIGYCNTEALDLTDRVSREQQMELGRTALRYRNPNNAPDAWEARVMQQFIDRQQAGEPLKGMNHSEIVEEEGQRYFRMLLAIPTQQACLTCHGGEIDPALEAKINHLYPDDQARGFKVGELRGAFTVKRAL